MELELGDKTILREIPGMRAGKIAPLKLPTLGSSSDGAYQNSLHHKR